MCSCVDVCVDSVEAVVEADSLQQTVVVKVEDFQHFSKVKESRCSR